MFNNNVDKENSLDPNQKPHIYWSKPNEDEDQTVLVLLNNPESLKTSCSSFPDDDKESEEKHCCGPAPMIWEERILDQDYITAYVPLPTDQSHIAVSSSTVLTFSPEITNGNSTGNLFETYSN